MNWFTRSVLYQYFLTRKTPTQQQYTNLIDSCFNLQEDTLPMAKVDGLNDALNGIYLALNTSNGGGAGSNSETFVVPGDFTKVFAAAKTLDSILIDPPNAGTYVMNIGTNGGGSDIVQGFSVDGDSPEPFIKAIKFKQNTTWYFSNVPANSTVTIYYKS